MSLTGDGRRRELTRVRGNDRCRFRPRAGLPLFVLSGSALAEARVPGTTALPPADTTAYAAQGVPLDTRALGECC